MLKDYDSSDETISDALIPPHPTSHQADIPPLSAPDILATQPNASAFPLAQQEIQLKQVCNLFSTFMLSYIILVIY